jgi:hypothetical protein
MFLLQYLPELPKVGRNNIIGGECLWVRILYVIQPNKFPLQKGKDGKKTYKQSH